MITSLSFVSTISRVFLCVQGARESISGLIILINVACLLLHSTRNANFDCNRKPENCMIISETNAKNNNVMSKSQQEIIISFFNRDQFYDSHNSFGTLSETVRPLATHSSDRVVLNWWNWWQNNEKTNRKDWFDGIENSQMDRKLAKNVNGRKKR